MFKLSLLYNKQYQNFAIVISNLNMLNNISINNDKISHKAKLIKTI